MKAITGKADLNDVIVAVNDAEMTLQTVVGLRDRMIQAYQEILRMPI
jgi:flagellar hook-basal body complex protein FliE